MMTETTKHREQATQYDLLCAIDELLQQDFAMHVEREALLDKMFEAWLQVPAFVRHGATADGTKTRSQSMHDELRAQRQKTFDARAWTWTRRVAGYKAGKLIIAHA